MKKVLILGGTMFVGRALVELLSSIEDFDITLFNRGKSNVGLFPGIKQIHGNRETDDVLQICNQNWDCVIDFSGYYPITFEKLLQALKGNVGRYIFISTISVYDLEKFGERTITEPDEIYSCSDAQKISKLPDAYGEKKAEMERILLSQDWLDKIILRPSFIYGRYDWTERFYYWLYRAKFCDKVLVPENFTMALTYAEDLKNAIYRAISVTNHQTIYNTISQTGVSLRDVVSTAASILNRSVDFVDAPKDFAGNHDLHSSPFPLFVPMNLSIDGNKWLKDFSITQVSFRSSIENTITYHDTIGWSAPKAGLSLEKEKEILRV